MRHIWLMGLTALVVAGCGQVGSDAEGISGDAVASAPTQAEISAAIRERFPAWYEPTEPFHMIGNIYYVGSVGLAVYLITDDAGHVLIDGGLPETAPLVLDNIRTLGFDPADVKTLLNTHAHFDHSGGLAALKAATGAELWASEGDQSALEGGFYLGSEDRAELNAPPVKVDRDVYDGTLVIFGDTALQANLTPGHSRGCTSWKLNVQVGERTLNVLIFCSATVAANRLAGPPQYEGIVEDYRATFAEASGWRPDVFLSNHPEFFNMAEKRTRLEAGEALAFVDWKGFPAMIERLERDFEAALADVETPE